MDYLIPITFAFGVLLVVWGLCVFGRRIIGKVWWVLGEWLQRWRK